MKWVIGAVVLSFIFLLGLTVFVTNSGYETCSITSDQEYRINVSGRCSPYQVRRSLHHLEKLREDSNDQ